MGPLNGFLLSSIIQDWIPNLLSIFPLGWHSSVVLYCCKIMRKYHRQSSYIHNLFVQLTGKSKSHRMYIKIVSQQCEESKDWVITLVLVKNYQETSTIKAPVDGGSICFNKMSSFPLVVTTCLQVITCKFVFLSLFKSHQSEHLAAIFRLVHG